MFDDIGDIWLVVFDKLNDVVNVSFICCCFVYLKLDIFGGIFIIVSFMFLIFLILEILLISFELFILFNLIFDLERGILGMFRILKRLFIFDNFVLFLLNFRLSILLGWNKFFLSE